LHRIRDKGTFDPSRNGIRLERESAGSSIVVIIAVVIVFVIIIMIIMIIMIINRYHSVALMPRSIGRSNVDKEAKRKQHDE
jgi:flagellar basal body-associated protein FliL